MAIKLIIEVGDKRFEVSLVLKEISIKNFKSFKEEVTFSMEALDRITEHQDHLVLRSNNKLLKVASIYGPNGGGKSNLIDALTFLNRMVNQEMFKDSLPILYKNIFANEPYTSFKVFFIDEFYEYGYELVLEFKDIDLVFKPMLENNLVSFKDYLNVVSETVIYRRNDEADFNLLYSRGKEVNLNFETEVLFKPLNHETLLANIYQNYVCKSIYKKDEASLIINNLYEEISSISPLGSLYFKLSGNDLKIKDKKKLINLLNNIDIKISDIIVDKNNPNLIYFERELVIDNKKVKKLIPLYQESNGTKKVFGIFVTLLSGINKKAIYYCDDMNSFLHPKLFMAIVDLFNSSENINSQLIFNSHEINAMNHDLFRRDEIWFAYRDESYETRLISLANMINFKGDDIKNHMDYQKEYLKGRFGADPFIRKVKIF